MLLADELRDAWRDETREHRAALLVVLAIGVSLRLLYLAQPMRNDEAVTYMQFVRLPWLDVVSTYSDPNNHVFHSLLAKAAVTTFGESAWALRMPAFVAGALIVPAGYAVARAIYGGRAAILAAALMAASGVLVLYSTNARGYSIVVLAFLLLVLLSIRLLASGRKSDWVLFAAIATLGLWTLPVMVYPLGSVAVWFILSALTGGRATEVRRFGVVAVAIVALAVGLYAPILARHGFEALRHRFAAPSDWLAFFVDLPLSLSVVALSWSLGMAPVLSLALLAVALIALRRHAVVSRFRIGLPLAVFVFSAWLLVVTHRSPLPRVWLWMLPVALSLASAGLVLVLERRPRTQRFIHERSGIGAVVVGLAIASSVVLSRAVLTSEETGSFHDAAPAVDALRSRLRPGDLVVTGGVATGLFDYYFDRKGVDRRHLSLAPSQARRVFLVVDAGAGQSLADMSVPRVVRDTMRFAPPVVAVTLSSAHIYLFERRDGRRP